MSNFRVVCLLRGYAEHCCAGVFTASGSSWSIVSLGVKVGCHMGSTKGSEYWHIGGRKVLSLDKSTAEFSCCVLPETTEERGGKVCLGATTGRDGKDRIVVFSEDGGNMTVFVRLHDGGSEWAAEKSVALRLPWRGWCSSQATYIDYIDTTRAAGTLIVVTRATVRFRVDIETNEVKPEPRYDYEERAHPCELPWPPTLRACTQILNG